MNNELNFKAASEPIDIANAIVGFPKPESVLQNAVYFEKGIIMPQYSVHGHLIGTEYAGLCFHFMVTPVFLNYADFRLTEDNQYELLCFDGDAVADFTEEDIADAAQEMEEAFDGYEDEQSYFVVYNPDSEYVSSDLKIGTHEPVWCQGHYERKKTAEEIAAENRNDEEDYEDYTTDYTLPIFKDENGDTLRFVAELYAGDVFGSYYLFYSPTTRLVRQFFQCT
jgi:hypothetical protein